MATTNYPAKTIHYKRTSGITNAIEIVVSFLNPPERDRPLYKGIFMTFARSRDQGLYGRNFASLRIATGADRAKFFRIMQRLEELKMVRSGGRTGKAKFYYLQKDFGAVLRKVARAYNQIL